MEQQYDEMADDIHLAPVTSKTTAEDRTCEEEPSMKVDSSMIPRARASGSFI